MVSEVDAYYELVSTFARVEGVELPSLGRGFGRAALKVDGRIFAMCPREQLVVKLPAAGWLS
jgi:hypothetical protein